MNSMDIKYDVAITSIGNLARTFLTNNSSAILLDEGIRPNLSDMVLEHTPGKLEEDIKKGDKLLMGGSKYTIEKVGDAVNENLREEGHCTLVFNAEGSMPGQIILKGPALPVLTVGAHITFTKK
jgi:PTS system glucitol/sorbitol-specific IIA component